MHTMGFLAHVTIFVLVVHGLSNVASHRLEIPDLDQRAPGTSEKEQGESTPNPPGEADGTRQLVKSAPERLVHGRSKRDLIVPGTKWCGRGNIADSYSDLGVHRETDMCCRAHDHCPDEITSWSTSHGLTNYLPYSILSCSCDDSFRSCLQSVNSGTSTTVGRLFFNTLNTPCFTLSNDRKSRCVERTWYGSCQRYEYYYELTAHRRSNPSY